MHVVQKKAPNGIQRHRSEPVLSSRPRPDSVPGAAAILALFLPWNPLQRLHEDPYSQPDRIYW